MATSNATTVKQYLAELPPDRRADIEAVRRVIVKNLPAGFEEGMEYGMIGYYVPLSRYPETYNGHPLCMAAIAAQKGYNSVYLMSVYSHPKLQRQFEAEYRKSGKKLDMGKSCVRFKNADDLPLDLIGRTIADVNLDAYIAHYEATRAKVKSSSRKAAPRPSSTSKSKAKSKRAAKK